VGTPASHVHDVTVMAWHQGTVVLPWGGVGWGERRQPSEMEKRFAAVV